jgi:hypothetical protein
MMHSSVSAASMPSDAALPRNPPIAQRPRIDVARTTTEKSSIDHQQGQPSFTCGRYLNHAACTAGFSSTASKRRQVMKKVIVAALATALTLATTAAFAQASGAMSSGTMAKEPMSKDTMKNGKTKHSKMKKGSEVKSGASSAQ